MGGRGGGTLARFICRATVSSCSEKKTYPGTRLEERAVLVLMISSGVGSTPKTNWAPSFETAGDLPEHVSLMVHLVTNGMSMYLPVQPGDRMRVT